MFTLDLRTARLQEHLKARHSELEEQRAQGCAEAASVQAALAAESESARLSAHALATAQAQLGEARTLAAQNRADADSSQERATAQESAATLLEERVASLEAAAADANAAQEQAVAAAELAQGAAAAAQVEVTRLMGVVSVREDRIAELAQGSRTMAAQRLDAQTQRDRLASEARAAQVRRREPAPNIQAPSCIPTQGYLSV